MSVLEAREVVAGYRHGRRSPVAVVEVTDLSAPAGNLVAVLGANGSGKSTLLRTLVGAQPPLSGTILLDGVALGRIDRLERARRIAVVLTDRIDPGWLTVGDVISLGRHPYTDWRGLLSEHDVDVARRAAERLGVAALWGRPFGELSDGQRQRALVARALAQEPSVLVLDEPTAFLDVAGRVELTIALAELAGDGLAVLVATHDLDLALSHADRVWLVYNGTVIDRTPEHLVSTGDLTRAFSDGTVEVDTRTGIVRARLRDGQPVVVHGDDLDSALVRRMVTRLGATVVDAGELGRPGPPDGSAWAIARVDGAWLLTRATERYLSTGFDELATSLRTELSRPRTAPVA